MVEFDEDEYVLVLKILVSLEFSNFSLEVDVSELDANVVVDNLVVVVAED